MVSKEPSKDLCRCISHELFRSVSKYPARVAVVHASGGIQICKEMNMNVTEEKSTILDRKEAVNSFPVYKGDVCFTYGELLSAVETLSFRIFGVLSGGEDPDFIRPKGFVYSTQATGVSKLDPSGDSYRLPKIIGVLMLPSVEYIIAIFSILRCGEAFLPLDPSWPQERLEQIATCSKLDLIITCKTSLPIDTWAQCRNSFSFLHFSMESKLQKNALSDLEWPCKSKTHRLYCYLMFTSGSTGKPKGICGTEEGLLNRFMWMQEVFPLCGGEALLFKTPVSFVDHLQEILASVLSCTPLIIPPFNDLKSYPFYLVEILKLYRISRLVTVPSLVRALVPELQRSKWKLLQKTLKLLVLSGETLSISLWKILHELFPKATIMNLYGSTEVSGDCTFFDCTYLPKILETETLCCVPIGIPISNCKVTLLENDTANEGEICVSGPCLFAGYLEDICKEEQFLKKNLSQYFKTGDLARRLQSGDLLFIGRKDRIVKVNGQRIALEEVEEALRGHPDVMDAAVVLENHGKTSELNYLKAHVVLHKNIESQSKISSLNEDKPLMASIKDFLTKLLPPVMLPIEYSFLDSFPVTSSGKVDYSALQNLSSLSKQQSLNSYKSQCIHDHVETMKEVFCDVLLLEKIEDNDDFFALGGNSILAALLSHRLGVDMRLLYNSPTPVSLVNSLLDRKFELRGKRLKLNNSFEGIHSDHYKVLLNDGNRTVRDLGEWFSRMDLPKLCSFSRCNRFTHKDSKCEVGQKGSMIIQSPKNKIWDFYGIWKVKLGSCVDASPLLVVNDSEVFVFIGSHSGMFYCLDAHSGVIQWETLLSGRIECSAACTSDYSHIVVGCYDGKIYFLNFDSGAISWIFQTHGEVKMQPLTWENLVWSGSHDHWVYALDYTKKCCVYKVFCGGSPYGSPAVDMANNLIYLASTSGRVTAVSVESSPFKVAWLHESGAPIFGSLSLDPVTGNVICCSVDGRVFALDLAGSVIWQAKTGGPIFAGACMSPALPSQVVVCSRDGSVYSFESNSGGLLWEYRLGDPITSSAYIDEQIQLTSEPSLSAKRLVCICGSSGRIRLLGVNEDVRSNAEQLQELGRADLAGDIFSSPVMIAGCIFVGCRDDHMHCIRAVLSTNDSHSNLSQGSFLNLIK